MATERTLNTGAQIAQPACFSAFRSLKLRRDADGQLIVEVHHNGGPIVWR